MPGPFERGETDTPSAYGTMHSVGFDHTDNADTRYTISAVTFPNTYRQGKDSPVNGAAITREQQGCANGWPGRDIRAAFEDGRLVYAREFAVDKTAYVLVVLGPPKLVEWKALAFLDSFRIARPGPGCK
jgi:hypothetical protein